METMVNNDIINDEVIEEATEVVANPAVYNGAWIATGAGAVVGIGVLIYAGVKYGVPAVKKGFKSIIGKKKANKYATAEPNVIDVEPVSED